MSKVEILPVKAWLDQEVPTSPVQLYQPYAIPTLPLVRNRRPMGTLNADGEANIPPELRRSPNLAEGFDFFDMVRDTGATPGDITLNIILTGAATAADLGPAGKDAPYEALVRRSAVSVYGLVGSLVMHETAHMQAQVRGIRYQQTYYQRIQDAAIDPTRLFNCDPLDDMQGGPAGYAEAAILEMADELVRLGKDTSDEDGTAGYFADLVYIQVQRYQAGRVGTACQSAFERNYGHAIGNVTVALPAEQLAIIDKFAALGAPAINVEYLPPSLHPDINREMNNYGNFISMGEVPAETFS